MTIREAKIEDIPQIQWVRNAVKENMLSDPGLVTDDDCRLFITERGKGWVGSALRPEPGQRLFTGEQAGKRLGFMVKTRSSFK